MIDCERATRLISDGLDRRLGPLERWRLQLHLRICDGCRRFGDQSSFLRLLARRYGAGESPDKPTDGD